MKMLLPATLLTLVAGTAGAQSLSGVELGLTGGYAGGLSGEFFVHAPNVVGPIGVKAGVAYTRAADAINDSSDLGVGPFSSYKAAGATENGSHTVASLDGTYNVGELAPGVSTALYAGARYGMFRSTEDYGATGNTTYSSNAFGLGAGVMLSYALTGNLSLVGDVGVDTFFKSTINATTTSGSGSTNTTINQGDALYNTIDNRFVRPGTVFKARIGIKTTF
ncbi:hypothetical protein [Deinococcus multiflagellatus]|uniref:Outer membrane protein beta-barrel domain-containing protein n=1 Tax=Deinococcus multiflagellatus TaxID=1656887 RepID=A0ABW1ZIC4_9DEIO|nr:hypothetical protein [Deinococcus multiflagellatus]MBZ9713662.1 hypothetical protein [Deinococcus multiflagellatus]